MERVLEGGYVNTVTTNEVVVTKHFNESGAIEVSAGIRLRRELLALNRFTTHHISPDILEASNTHITQSLVDGESLENLVRQGEIVMHHAGSLLREIHTPVTRPAEYLRGDFQKKAQRVTSGAASILNYENITVSFDVNWSEVFKLGTTRIHGDFWLGNILHDGRQSVAIDWEYAGIGSPYEDFAAITLHATGRYGQTTEFWNAYGYKPHEKTLREYVKLLCIDNLSGVQLKDYLSEPQDGFYHRMTNVLKAISN